MAALGYATRHVNRVGRPRGGSGALTDAIKASFEAAGGKVRCGVRVENILIQNGSVSGVRLADGLSCTNLKRGVLIRKLFKR